VILLKVSYRADNGHISTWHIGKPRKKANTQRQHKHDIPGRLANGNYAAKRDDYRDTKTAPKDRF
jgi:hypothetical protein